MKRQLPLKWNLTLGMLGVWVIVMSLVFLRIGSTMRGINSVFVDMFKRDTYAEAVILASEAAPLIEAKDGKKASSLLDKFKTSKPEITIAAVLDPNRRVVYRPDNSQDEKPFLKMVETLSVQSPVDSDGNFITAIAAVKSISGKIAGYVMLVTSKEIYNEQKESSIAVLIIVVIIGLALATVSAYVIGGRLTRPIGTLVEAAERIADGDLERIDIASEGSQELHRLGASIKRMAEAMQSQVLAIKNLTTKITTISRETEGTMTNLASSAAQQAAAVNETAATVEEMEKAGQSSAGNAKHIVAAAEKTAEASKRGRHTVEKTYEIIMQIKDDSHDLSEKSKNLLNSVEEVGNIIQSVNSIAEQSKILAVNASIEAAKAGEFGSGFAVVAQEVKDLAQQSKDATLQITGTLTAIRAAIETMVGTAQRGKERTAEGVNSISNAGAVMNDLSEAIRENSDFAKLIASNIQQQTIGLTQIAAAVEEINTTALENQSISRNIVHGTRQMNETLGLLRDMVGRWRTPNQT
jgi:methyl-accepting chemotaxis protein